MGPPSGLIVVHWHAVLTADLKQGWISALLVDPDRRRNGVARLLLKAASQAARAAGCDKLCLYAPDALGDLRAFGIATGFVETGRVPPVPCESEADPRHHRTLGPLQKPDIQHSVSLGEPAPPPSELTSRGTAYFGGTAPSSLGFCHQPPDALPAGPRSPLRET
jgi:hypothetical protein